MSFDSVFASFPSISESDHHHQIDASSSSSSPSPPPLETAEAARRWRDVFWLCVFVLHLLAVGLVLGLLGLNRFRKADRFNIDRFTNMTTAVQVPTPRSQLTETFWPLYGAAGGVGAVLAGAWLTLLGSRAEQMMKVSVHSLTTYLAVISVLCFWGKYFFWGVAFAVGAGLQFMYVMSVMDR